jgi:vancomycin aglycone glucosyltransferase
MRVLLSTYGSRGDVEPLAGLAVRLQALGAEVRMCAPPDEEFAALLAGAGVPLVPFERPWRSWLRPSTAAERTRRVAELGIGTAHDGPAPTAESLSAALRTALTAQTRARAAAVAGAIRTDGASAAAARLTGAVSRERPPVSA